MNKLTEQREDFIERLRIGRHQLGQQEHVVSELEVLLEGNFGHHYAEKMPVCFWQIVERRPVAFTALQIIPRLKAWIAKRECELEEVEAAIAALADGARPPALV